MDGDEIRRRPFLYLKLPEIQQLILLKVCCSAVNLKGEI